MIYLKKGQTLFDNPGMVVYDQTGYYDDGTSIICAPIFAPEEPACRYEAKYIAYGGVVYSISNEEELLKQILELDPKSLFGKDSKQVAIDKVTDNIVTQGTSEVTDENPKTEVEEEKKVEETEPEQVVETPATTTPEVTVPEDTSVTPPVVEVTPTTDFPPTTTPPEELLPVDTELLTPEDVIAPVEDIAVESIESSTPTE
jgi:hypothetical protein